MKRVLDKARSLLRRRKFSHVISILESGQNPDIYSDNFDYFIIAGTACLYLGDIGSASVYFQRARHIRLTDSTLLNAQAVIFLHRGDTEKAINYYVDVLDNDPENKIALEALEFIRNHGTYEEVCRAIDSGEIKKFYPPLGVNPDWIRRIVLSAACGVLIAVGILNFKNFTNFVRGYQSRPYSYKSSNSKDGVDLSSLYLTVEEIENPHKSDLSVGTYKFILSDKDIKKSYDLAIKYFHDHKENASRVEINRLLNSNASDEIKGKAKMIESYFSEPTFDSLSDNSDNISYSEVAKEPELYIGCTVHWSGRIANAVLEEDSLRCNLLVGYDNMDKLDGITPLVFEKAPEPPIDGERAVQVLAKISVEDSKILLEGKTVYQAVKPRS